MHTIMKNRELVFFISHLDDFEFSCLGFLFKNHQRYQRIKIIIATTWIEKEKIWEENLLRIIDFVGRDIEYINLGFPQRTLSKNFDDMKDKFYKNLTFCDYCDIITHDVEDLHSDHNSVHKAAIGMLKHSDKFITIYSPSSYGYIPNYYVSMSENEFNFKHHLLTQYDFTKEQSYSKKGSYFRKEYTNIAGIYSMENFINREMEYCEIYKIYKWVE